MDKRSTLIGVLPTLFRSTSSRSSFFLLLGFLVVGVWGRPPSAIGADKPSAAGADKAKTPSAGKTKTSGVDTSNTNNSATDKPNTLSAADIADGWFLLFDGETTFGWRSEGAVAVRDGKLVIGGPERSAATCTTPLVGVEFRFQAEGNGQLVLTTGGSKSSIGVAGRLSRVEGRIQRGRGLSTSNQSATDGHGRTLQTILATVDRPAEIGFTTEPGATLHIHSLAVRPIGATRLFNGKDLSGWKEFPGSPQRKVASRFTVTKDGWLNVQNGPGDLQTEGQWADFILQLECISHGKHLNSGIFFRCIPGQYQQGYEVQIRNQWEGDDRSRPVDFGTGGIYRRQPARKVVASDGEWFTLTLAAQGRHIATWVNGWQTADWTDDRKEADNARQGFKREKGAISIQGHDPTTNLSFRNLRIVSWD